MGGTLLLSLSQVQKHRSLVGYFRCMPFYAMEREIEVKAVVAFIPTHSKKWSAPATHLGAILACCTHRERGANIPLLLFCNLSRLTSLKEEMEHNKQARLFNHWSRRH